MGAWRGGVLCAAAAAASLLVLRVPSYDPTAWLIWGRELLHGTLSTAASPSWKPLPVAFTTVFAIAGDHAAPALWLLVARAGGLAGILLAFRLAGRLGGRASGWLAVAGLCLGTDVLYNTVRGDSEGLLVALAVGAVLLHLDGRRWAALSAGLLAAGLRPETWLLVAVYAVWLARDRRRPAVWVLLVVVALLMLAAWFVPDHLATGDWLRGADRATQPEPGSPGQSAFPIGSVLLESLTILVWPFYLGLVAAVTRSHRDPTVLALAAAAAVLTLEVAALAQAGFTGSIRYLTLPAALVAVVGGVGLAPLVRLAYERLPRIVGVALVAAAALAALGKIDAMVTRGTRLAGEERAMDVGLRRAIDIAGGPAAVRACGRTASTPYQRARVAYDLRLPQVAVAARAPARGTMFVRRNQSGAGAARLPVRGVTRDWVIRSSC